MANGLMIEREAPLPGVAELRVHGDVDLGGGKRLERELEALMADGRSVLVNLEGCTFLDSSGLSALLRTARQTPLRGASPSTARRRERSARSSRSFAPTRCSTCTPTATRRWRPWPADGPRERASWHGIVAGPRGQAGHGPWSRPAGRHGRMAVRTRPPSNTSPGLIDALRDINPRVDVADFDHHGYGRIEATEDGLTCDLVRMATIKSRTSKKVAPISYDVKRRQTSIRGVNGPPPKQS